MKKVAYVGGFDIRNLGPEDFAKVGVETTKEFEFRARQAVEVANDVAAALLEYPTFFGKFEEANSVPEGETLDFSRIEQTEDEVKPDEAPVAGSGEVLNAPQTGIDSPAPKRGARASTT